MRRPTLALLAVVAVAVLLLAGAPSAGASPQDPARFEILQAAYHPLNALAPTGQNLSERCVLLEQYAGLGGPQNANARAASDALVNNTTRRALAFAEYHPTHTRFVDYYRASFVPTGIFDGTQWEFGGGQQTLVHYEAGYELARQAPAGASINVTGGVAISNGYIDFDVFSPFNLSAQFVSVRALIVEDPVVSPQDGRELRYVVRQYVVGQRIELLGDSSHTGRFEFTVDPSWVESRLAAVVFVQVDGPRGFEIPAPSAPVDLLGALLVPLAVLVTGSVMAVILVRFVSAERRARLR